MHASGPSKYQPQIQMSIAHSFLVALCRLQEAEAQRERQRAQTPPRASRASLLTTLIYFAEDGQLSDHIDMVHTLPTFCQPAPSEPESQDESQSSPARGAFQVTQRLRPLPSPYS